MHSQHSHGFFKKLLLTSFASGAILFSFAASAQTVYQKAVKLFVGATALDADSALTLAGKNFSGSCVSQSASSQTTASQISIAVLNDPILGQQFNAVTNPWLNGPASTFRLAPTQWQGQTSFGWKSSYYSNTYNYNFPVVCNLRLDSQGLLVSQCAVSYCLYSRVDGGLPGDNRQICSEAGWDLNYCWYSSPGK